MLRSKVQADTRLKGQGRANWEDTAAEIMNGQGLSEEQEVSKGHDESKGQDVSKCQDVTNREEVSNGQEDMM